MANFIPPANGASIERYLKTIEDCCLGKIVKNWLTKTALVANHATKCLLMMPILS